MRAHLWVCSVGVGVWLGSSSVARAGNDDELFVGNQAAMLGGAISATVKDSSATWYNPAGLGEIERDQVDVSATVYTLRLYNAPRFIESTTGEVDDGSVAEFVVAPSQIAYVRRLSPTTSLGLGYFVPRASNYVLREALVAGRSSERSDWQLAASIAEVQHTAAAAIGHAISPQIRVGASLIGGYGTSTHSIILFGSRLNARQAAAGSSTNLIGTETRVTFELGLGLQLNLTDHWVMGIAVRSPQLQLYASSDAVLNQLTASLEDPENPVIGFAPSHDQESAGPGLRRAGRAGLAIAYVYDRGRVSAEIDVQPAIEREELELDRKTLVNARVGFYHSLGGALALGLGFFTDRLGEAESWSFVSGGGDFYGGTVGLELSNEHLLAPSERVSSLIFNSVFALRYAFSDGDFGTIVVDPDSIASGEGPFNSVKRDLIVHELGLYVGSGLRF